MVVVLIGLGGGIRWVWVSLVAMLIGFDGGADWVWWWLFWAWVWWWVFVLGLSCWWVVERRKRRDKN